MLRALKLPGVRWILGLHAADLVLEYASSVALMVLVYDATNSPLAAAAMLFAKQVVPGALLALVGRVLEGVDARLGLAASYVARALAFGGLVLVGGGLALYALAFAAGLAGVASRVFIRATVARGTAGRAFRDVTAAQNVVFGVATLAGPAVGALGASAAGAQASLLLWVVVAGMLAMATLTMPARLRRASAHPDPIDDGLVDAPATGVAVVQAPVWSMLALGGVLGCIFSMDEPALLAYVRQALGGDVGLYGTILVVWGAGVIVGGLIYSRIGVRAPLQAIVGGVLCTATGYIGLGIAPSVALACLAAVLGGVGNGMYWVSLATAVLERAPDGQEARVAGRLEGIATAAPALGIVLGGAVAQWVDPRVTLWAPGLLALIVLAGWLGLVGRAAARIEQEPSIELVAAEPRPAVPGEVLA